MNPCKNTGRKVVCKEGAVPFPWCSFSYDDDLSSLIDNKMIELVQKSKVLAFWNQK